jgi:hypothetical protein
MIRTAFLLVRDLLHFVALTCSSRDRLAAENLFLRKQLAFYIERKVKPRRLNDAAKNRTRRAGASHRLATAPRRRAPGYVRAMAPPGLPPLLALEITAPGPAANSGVPPGLDRRDGAGESDLG